MRTRFPSAPDERFQSHVCNPKYHNLQRLISSKWISPSFIKSHFTSKPKCPHKATHHLSMKWPTLGRVWILLQPAWSVWNKLYSHTRKKRTRPLQVEYILLEHIVIVLYCTWLEISYGPLNVFQGKLRVLVRVWSTLMVLHILVSSKISLRSFVRSSVCPSRASYKQHERWLQVN